MMVWSNAQPGATFTVQTAALLTGGTNWVDYVQIPTTNGVNTNLIMAFNPPAGMALIPAGSYTMGNSIHDGDITDAATVGVYVSAFYLDSHSVTYGLWQSVYNWATSHGYSFDYPGLGKASNNPVQTVDWYDCVKWCNARSEMAQLTPCYYTSAGQTTIYRTGDLDLGSTSVKWTVKGYRLPTEAEWEKAARGGLSGQRFPWGNIISESRANYQGDIAAYPSYDQGPTGYNPLGTNGGMPYTCAVGSFAPNGYGLYDMAGNIYDWCWDWYATTYAGEPTRAARLPAQPAHFAAAVLSLPRTTTGRRTAATSLRPPTATVSVSAVHCPPVREWSGELSGPAQRGLSRPGGVIPARTKSMAAFSSFIIRPAAFERSPVNPAPADNE